MATPCRRLLLAAILLSTILLPTSLASAASAETCVPVPQTVARDRLAALSRGFNADGWINGEKSAPPTRELLQQLRKAGMSHVRLPVSAERVMLRFASKAERDETLRALDKALKLLISLGYSISVDLHPGDRFNRLHKDDADASLRELEDAWGTLAQVIQSFPADRRSKRSPPSFANCFPRPR
jgi:endoglucanase